MNESVLGLKSGTVCLVPWSPEWDAEYLLESDKIKNVLGKYMYAIHHVGSTSIKEISAKPIIDIAIEVFDFKDGIICGEKLTSLGYTYRGTDIIPGRHFLSKGEPRTFHIHMFSKGDTSLLEQLRFRDYLNRKPEVRKDYENLKIQLSKQFSNNRSEYTAGKSNFIQTILRQSDLIKK